MMMWLYAWLQDAIAIQREIYTSFSDRIGEFARTGDWVPLLVYLPMGIVFGVVHAMTPGHSKTLLATYLAGSTSSMPRALMVSWTLSFVHVTMAVLIAVLALPLVSAKLGSFGRAPVLEGLSRGLLGAVGLWMIWQAFRDDHAHGGREGLLVGLFAGLIPCPLTLFVMTFAILRGVPEAGIAFAGTMLVGVALVLTVVAVLAVLFRQQLLRLLTRWPRVVRDIVCGTQILAGSALVAFAVLAMLDL